MSTIVSFLSFVVAISLAGGLGVSGAVAARAQDDSQPESHPSHIHAGTCEDLDPNPAAPLNNVTPIGVDLDSEDGESADLEPVGVLTASPILHADSEEFEFNWDEMLEESHAINIHESDENIQNYIACGDIGGVVVDDGDQLVIALHPQNDSGYTGIAILNKDDDDNVDVEIFLVAPADGAVPVATPSS